MLENDENVVSVNVKRPLESIKATFWLFSKGSLVFALHVG